MSAGRRALDVGLRAALLTLLWWVLVEGEMHGPALAIASVAMALGASLVLVPRVRWRLPVGAIATFIPYFLWQSVRGGLDVARRAIHPRLPISPRLVEYEPGLRTPSSRALFAGIVSLLPGTLSVDLPEAGPLRMHVLDGAGYEPRSLARLERLVAGLLEPPPPR
jgi:multicomponent Na+:H+ antiporter subunit E